ncbi:MAG: NAD-dependent epimerase/dehydratase family protein [Dehalococcoidia bacterium]
MVHILRGGPRWIAIKIFITGATGFVGMNLANRLAQTDHEMYCLVRKISRADTLKQLGATFIEGDVTDKPSILEGMQGCDWVVNLANIYSFWEPDRKIYKEVNVKGTRNVMECALEAGVSKVIHVSSLVIYGKPEDCPFTEDSEVGPVRFGEYARTKYEGDLIAWELYKGKDLPLVMLYLGSVTGAGDPKPTGQWINNAINGRIPVRFFENSILTYVHVGDVADSIVKALEKENNIGEKYLIGKPRLSIREVNELISDVAGGPLPKMRLPDSLVMSSAAILTLLANITRKPPALGMSIDQMRTIREGSQFDSSKSEKELGITYTPIRTAIEEAIASFQSREH